MNLPDYDFKISYGPADDRLHDFYIPALSASVRYDRSAGFFSSSALAVAAAGVARLIANGGVMRLLVGAELSAADVNAIAQGQTLADVVAVKLIAALQEPPDELLRRRLEVLAWMVGAGTLQIKVVLPKGPDGQPLPATRAQDYYHPKEGVFTDRAGNQLGFSGSVNESLTAWQHNYELFFVFPTWEKAYQLHVAQIRHRFERLWNDQEPLWQALDIPAAARCQLLKYRSAERPTHDPLERETALRVIKETELTGTFDSTGQLQRERVLFQYLRDAPHLLYNQGLGAATSAVEPWPHQTQVAAALVAQFPERFMLCDEVGLGKTIEAGLALRQLWLAGYVRRCLILAPKSVCQQWQEELYEKFALDVPFFDGHNFHRLTLSQVPGTSKVPGTSNPWDGADLFIASSQLAKRRERQRELLAARPWDLVIVDEAHHARRKDFLAHRYRPNRLLELLRGHGNSPGLQDCTRSIWLMTATPMQVHPVEVWDLLKVLGLGGRWGASDENFLHFFQELRRAPADAEWSFIFDMVRDNLTTGGTLDAAFVNQAERELGLVEWEQLRACVVGEHVPDALQLQQCAQQYQPIATELARRHTPLRRYLFRSTRRLLREYAARGILRAVIPRRDPQPVWITMSAAEHELYLRIEEYITNFYRKYENERKGLGFVMTVYRRRLTSSFYAVRRSLNRRLAFLRGQVAAEELADDDDWEQDDLSYDTSEMLGAAERARFQEEIAYVEDFLHELREFGDHDSKVARLQGDLEELFRKRDKVLVFTQYTDTLDFLRGQLRPVYGEQVACYSGRGGEVWNGITWVPTTKEEIKNAFLGGERIKILLCTEAASEGLNLQTCGVLINYDMPWNPMRVEQRIGRIDRIGQKYGRVWIRHYFYADTVEAQVYAALEDRIGWFEDVVGELQPILAQLGRTIQNLAMLPEEERRQALAQALTRLREQAEAQALDWVDLDEYLLSTDPQHAHAASVTLADLERIITRQPALAARFQPHPEFARAYWLRWAGQDIAVTFDKEAFDAHPNTLQLLTYGNPLLAELLTEIPPPDAPYYAHTDHLEGSILRCAVDNPLPLYAYYAPNATGQPQLLERVGDLEDFYAHQSRVAWTTETLAAAQADFQRQVVELQRKQEQINAARQRAAQLALVAQARQVLRRAALIELALSEQPELFAEDKLPSTFSEGAVTGLSRHGYPFAPLLRLVSVAGLRPKPTDKFYGRIQGKSQKALRGHFLALREQAERLVEMLTREKT